MTPDETRSAAPAPASAPRPHGAIPPPIEELTYETVGPVRRWVYRIILAVLVVGGLGAFLFVITGPHVPAEAVRVARTFAEAVNAGDFQRQFALLASAEPVGPQGADIPLLDETKLKLTLNSAVEPSFFCGFQVRPDFSRGEYSVRGAHQIWTFALPIEDFASAPPPVSGQRSGYFSIHVDVTRRPYRVMAFATYTSFYFNNYSLDTNMKITRLLLSQYGAESPTLPAPDAAPR